MSPKGYTTPLMITEEIGDASNVEYSPDWANVIEAVEAYIDRYTGRAWAVPSSIVDELHTVRSPYLFLDQKPVTAVISVKVRVAAVGTPETVLAQGSDYELVDATNGILLINAAYPFGYDVVVNTTEYAGYITKVSYTTSTPVPADIQRAATVLAVSWLAPRLLGITSSQQAVAAGIKSFSAGQDLSVTFDTAAGIRAGEDASSSVVIDILKRYRRMVLV